MKISSFPRNTHSAHLHPNSTLVALTSPSSRMTQALVEEEEYSWAEFKADLGGTVGLWLGVSVWGLMGKVERVVRMWK